MFLIFSILKNYCIKTLKKKYLMDYKLGYLIATTMILILIIRTINSKEVKKPNFIELPVIIRCIEGAKNITIESLSKIIFKFSNDIRNNINVIDDNNYNEFIDLIMNCDDKINDWVNKQNDLNFTISILHENDAIDEETYTLKNNILTISEIIYGSKTDTEEPVEDKNDPNTLVMSPNKVKYKLLNLAKTLHLLHKAIDSKKSCTSDVFDIIPIEKLIRKIGNKISSLNSAVSQQSNNKNIPINNSQHTQHSHNKIDKFSICKSSDLQLNNNDWDSSSIIIKKSSNKSNSFPQINNYPGNRNNIIL